MKSIVAFLVRCVNALLWSLGLSSVVVLLMLGFYICWTQPVSKTVNVDLAEKPAPARVPVYTKTPAAMVIEKRSVYAGL
jgi:hypothetical protein